MRIRGKFELGGGVLVRVAARDELLGQAALQLTQPMARGAMEMLTKQALQLALGNRAQTRHLRWAEISLPRHLLPLLDGQKTSTHVQSVWHHHEPPALIDTCSADLYSTSASGDQQAPPEIGRLRRSTVIVVSLVKADKSVWTNEKNCLKPKCLSKSDIDCL